MKLGTELHFLSIGVNVNVDVKFVDDGTELVERQLFCSGLVLNGREMEK